MFSPSETCLQLSERVLLTRVAQKPMQQKQETWGSKYYKCPPSDVVSQ